MYPSPPFHQVHQRPCNTSYIELDLIFITFVDHAGSFSGLAAQLLGGFDPCAATLSPAETGRTTRVGASLAAALVAPERAANLAAGVDSRDAVAAGLRCAFIGFFYKEGGTGGGSRKFEKRAYSFHSEPQGVPCISDKIPCRHCHTAVISHVISGTWHNFRKDNINIHILCTCASDRSTHLS